MITLYALAAAFGIGVLWLGTNIKVVKQFERGVVFRFGRVQSGLRGPGLTMLIPIADRLEKVNMQIITMPVPAQDGITRDNVTVRVDAVIYFKVSDPVRAAVDVQDYVSAIGQVAQTSLRSIIGKSNLDDLLSNREHLNQGLELMIDSPALGWGVQIDRVWYFPSLSNCSDFWNAPHRKHPSAGTRPPVLRWSAVKDTRVN